MREEMGDENFFLFGMTVDQVEDLARQGSVQGTRHSVGGGRHLVNDMVGILWGYKSKNDPAGNGCPVGDFNAHNVFKMFRSPALARRWKA